MQKSLLFPAYIAPENTPFLQKFAQYNQGLIITEKQFFALLAHFLHSQEKSYPLFGWYYSNRQRLKRYLASYDIVVSGGH